MVDDHPVLDPRGLWAHGEQELGQVVGQERRGGGGEAAGHVGVADARDAMLGLVHLIGTRGLDVAARLSHTDTCTHVSARRMPASPHASLFVLIRLVR